MHNRVPLTAVRGVFSVRDILEQLGQMLAATTHSIYADEGKVYVSLRCVTFPHGTCCAEDRQCECDVK